MRRPQTFVAVLLCSALLPGQQIHGPVETFTFDAPTASLRPVLGTLGSASLGPALLSGLDYASVAPRHNHAIAFRGGRGVVVSGLGSAQMSITDLPDSIPAPDSVAWSRDGSLAILYSRAGNWIRVLAGLPGSPSPGPEISEATLRGALSAVATDSRGSRIAVAVVGENAGVYEVTASEGLAPLLSVENPTALAFSVDGAALYVLDRKSAQLFELQMSDLSSRSWPVERLQDPFAVSCSQDDTGRLVVYVAAHQDNLLRVYDASTYEVIADVSLSVQPTALDPLGVRSYLLRPRVASDDPLWSFTNASRPMVYFVPATPLDTEVGEDRSR